jgi:hypothetical protein
MLAAMLIEALAHGLGLPELKRWSWRRDTRSLPCSRKEQVYARRAGDKFADYNSTNHSSIVEIAENAPPSYLLWGCLAAVDRRKWRAAKHRRELTKCSPPCEMAQQAYYS